MNKKAEKFMESLGDALKDVFEMEDLKDEYNTVLFRSHMDIKGQHLPIVLIMDNSIYTMCRIWVAMKLVDENNKQRLQDYIDGMNAHYKIFKYYTTEKGDLVLDCCIPATEEEFDPNIVRAVTDVAVKHLEETYAETMKNIWVEA